MDLTVRVDLKFFLTLISPFDNFQNSLSDSLPQSIIFFNSLASTMDDFDYILGSSIFPTGFLFGSLAVGAHPILSKLLMEITFNYNYIISINNSPMNQNPYGENIDSDERNHQDSYARLNKQYGPISNDIRNSYNDYAAQLNPLQSKDKSYHIRSLFASLIFLFGEATVLTLYFVHVIQVEIGELVGICVGIYVFYLLLGLCCNPLLSYLSNIEHGSNFQNQYNRVRNIIGHFRFHAQCYHYQTRYHTRTVRDSDGNTRTQTYTTQEKVVTHVANQTINPITTFDDSGNVDQVRAPTDVIFVHMNVSYRFNDQRSRYIFERMWDSFRNRHRRDSYQDYSYNYNVPGLKERMAFYIGTGHQNYKCMLIAFSIFGGIWPVSMYIEGKVSRFNIDFMKILTM